MKILLWYRNDLRIHDHEALFKASEKTSEVIPVYIFDPRIFQEHHLGFAKTGELRRQFLIESVQNLRENLQKINSNLIVRMGFPEDIIPALAKEIQADEVYTSEEITQEEIDVDSVVEAQLKADGRKIKFFWQSTLYHIDDLPMDVENLPDIFTQFRNKVERNAKIRPVFKTPTNLIFKETIGLVEIPSLPQNTNTIFKGGEDEGINRLNDYFWEKDLLKVYKETRNEMLGLDYSSKFSLWLANGCISPRYIYEEIKKYEAERTQNESTYWLIFELLWRDYFRFVAMKFGNKIFYKSGLKGNPTQPSPKGRAIDIKSPPSRGGLGGVFPIFEKWRLGETGVPLIDANMKELLATGFMSNRGRQNVASFLVKDLQIDWRWGAAWFESQLIDYDVCSNWGNWLYVAGVGNDPRENRYFNILKQATNYDGKGEYVKYWLPELSEVPNEKIHLVGLLSNEEQKKFGVRLGVDYPNPIVDVKKWIKG
ncbi:deoxyribodipyrimidine photo-lyase (single-stranded DNA-specific) [Arcicella aurantiaca]|uniref:Cryptochrome DASH n=2 Tax=Arcicella aurantiaca TaxID=591202 RepID=A0A316E9M9_9BACT|nr:deoxyribodipyrimidine photo-lyase (single-stranded DNA-specific) [Arcicella aurantiaca]